MREIEKIIEIEDRYNLFEKSILGVFFWKLIRLEVYERIMFNKGYHKKAQNNTNTRFFNILSEMPNILINTFIRSWSLDFSQKDVLVFRHPRKVMVNNDYIDIYTKYLEDEMKLSSIDYGSIDFPNNLIHRTKYDGSVKNIESISLGMDYLYGLLQRKIILKHRISKEDYELINDLNEIINSSFKVNINLSEIVIRAIAKFNYRKKFYTRILKRKKPNRIYLVVHYSRHELIAAAHELGIKSIEIQHGIITPFHLGYSYGANTNIPYFPDSMILYGSIWNNMVNIPILNYNLILRKFDYLYEQKNRLASIQKENAITIVSQGTVGENLFSFATDLACKLENHTIYYKLHPGEFLTWKSKVNEIELPQNIKLIFDEETILSLFSKSNYIVGVYSTAVYEALFFECNIIVLKLPGYEYMNYLLENKYAKLVETVEDTVAYIKLNNSIRNNINYNIIFGSE
ncbi:hypothetical protein HZI73_23110 [Vallitalea pronyensis]|uniref:Capsule polysaccharide biosynthesis protein n=1 Tax=Vallitalea pronyensis TaxID=1348613 RepID=A0A8J8SJ11_9FIRM|nr:hypothetical protein [Vallitalea pronyensis]QUI25004.1 hypothetical protein HZI73_23110 [Vallitalea pronyensis]